MIVRFLSCRERFRLRYVLGLEPYEKWNHRLGYGEMWHVCEEALAGQFGAPSQETEWKATEESTKSYKPWYKALADHTIRTCDKYPLQREEIQKWHWVCSVQFPEYVKYWSEHPDVQNRTPLMQEQVFDVPYQLPSGRTVRLRGKFDSVDLITDEITGPQGGIYLAENKTKGDIDKLQIERQLKFDLQTLMYLIALKEDNEEGNAESIANHLSPYKPGVLGVRYNVVRRPLSGGKGSIRPHAEKRTKNKVTPAETDEEFFERLRRDYIAAEPDYWFFRVRADVSAKDIQVFKETCLDPILEHMCIWYYDILNKPKEIWFQEGNQLNFAASRYFHYRTPFGVYSALEEGGATEYDALLETGSEAGLRRTEELFTELKQ